MTRRIILTALAIAAIVPLAGCELAPGQPDHITVTEIEAPWVQVTPPTELWVEMIPVGDFEGRCVTNLGGTFYNDGRGQICEVGLDQDNPT